MAKIPNRDRRNIPSRPPPPPSNVQIHKTVQIQEAESRIAMWEAITELVNTATEAIQEILEQAREDR